MRDSVTYNASFPVANVVLKFYTSLGPVPKGYTKRQKFLERQKHLENSNQSHVEARNRVYLEKWPKGAISKYCLSTFSYDREGARNRGKTWGNR